MATPEKSTAGTHPVGRVTVLDDQAKAISPDGTERILAAESPVFAHDRIITQGDGRVSIVIDDDSRTRIDLEGKSDLIIDEDIFGGAGSAEVAEVAADAEEVREAFFIRDIDLSAEPQANTDDSLADAVGGREVADFDRITHEGNLAKTAGEKYSVIFDENDYTDLDNGNPDDPLDHLIDTDDSTS